MKDGENEEKCLYRVQETKGSKDPADLRGKEYAKVRCGEAHFSVLDVTFQYGPDPDDV